MFLQACGYPGDRISWGGGGEYCTPSPGVKSTAASVHPTETLSCFQMPMLKPEDMSMIGLSLFTQLCGLARVANASLEKPLPDDQICGMDQLWGIALRAQNTDVSLNAIHYLNNHYISCK